MPRDTADAILMHLLSTVLSNMARQSRSAHAHTLPAHSGRGSGSQMGGRGQCVGGEERVGRVVMGEGGNVKSSSFGDKSGGGVTTEWDACMEDPVIQRVEAIVRGVFGSSSLISCSGACTVCVCTCVHMCVCARKRTPSLSLSLSISLCLSLSLSLSLSLNLPLSRARAHTHTHNLSFPLSSLSLLPLLCTRELTPREQHLSISLR